MSEKRSARPKLTTEELREIRSRTDAMLAQMTEILKTVDKELESRASD